MAITPTIYWAIQDNELSLSSSSVSGTYSGSFAGTTRFVYESSAPWHSYRNTITKIIIEDIDTYIVPQYIDYWFSNMSKLESIVSASRLDVSNITNMHGLFKNCSSLTSLDLSSWNTDEVVDIEEMFCLCTSLTLLNLSGWNVSNIDSMAETFATCVSLTSLDLSNWDMSNVTNMYGCFSGCANLITAPDLSSCTSLTNMFGCFASCTNLITAPVIPSTVTDIEGCFWGCRNLRGKITVNSNNITNTDDFGKTYYPIKLTGSASNDILFGLSSSLSNNRNVYVNRTEGLEYANPSVQNISLARCNQDGTSNNNGDYVKVSFKLSMFKDGLPNSLNNVYQNYFETLTAFINGVQHNITTILDENNQSYTVKYGDLDITKTYHFITQDINQSAMAITLQTTDKFNTSIQQYASLDLYGVQNKYLKYKDDNGTKSFLYPVIPADNVVMLNSNFKNNNIYDIIWEELFQEE